MKKLTDYTEQELLVRLVMDTKAMRKNIQFFAIVLILQLVIGGSIALLAMTS